MRPLSLLFLCILLAHGAEPKKKLLKPTPGTPDSPPAFATTSTQAASLQRQRAAIAKQRAALGVPESESSFFSLPSAFQNPADSPFFILSGK